MRKVRVLFFFFFNPERPAALVLLLDQKARFWVLVCESHQSSTLAEKGELLNISAGNSWSAKCCFSGLNRGACVMTGKPS